MARMGLVAALLAPQAATAQTPQEWRDSLAVLSRQIELAPRSVELRLRKAAVNLELQQWDYAIEEYGRVTELEPDNLAAHFFRAYAYASTRRYDLARNDYEAVLAQVPRHFEARLGLAMVMRKMGRQRDATDALNHLVELFPDSALAYAARAGYETELRQYELALYDWDEAISRSPVDASLVASKVDVLLALRRNDEAWAELEQAMRRGIPRGVLKEWIDRCK